MRAHNSYIQPTRRSRHRRIPVLMGGRAFLPSGIAGLHRWHRAYNLASLFQDAVKTMLSANGDVVGAWVDEALGNDAQQVTTSKKPTRQDGIVNGLTVVRGDTDDSLGITGPALTNETIFAVVRHAADTVRGTIIAESTTHRLQFQAAQNVIQYRYAAIEASVSIGFVEANFNIYRAMYDGTTAAVAVNNGTPGTALAAPNAHTYATLFSRGVSNFLNDDIAELIIYDTALSVANIALVENYLSNKWGIAIA